MTAVPTGRPRRRRPLSLGVASLGALSLAAFPLAGGCGAKTGLERPVPEPVNPEPDPLDAGVPAPPGPPRVCVSLPPGARPLEVEVEVPAVLATVDVFFLLDATGSMVDEITNVRRGLRERVVPGVRDIIPDAAFGVGLVGEFPVDPHGDDDVRPYELRSPITESVLAVEGALERLPEWANRDEPEAQVEGLFQTATGEGYSGPGAIPPSRGCPRGGSGGACFRDEALPVILLVTDAPFHHGPPGVSPVSPYRFSPPPHTYQDAVDALRSLGALVLGLAARDEGAMTPAAHLRAVARDTGAVGADGAPLVLDIGASGDRVGRGVVDAIERLASDVPLDVDGVLRDVGGDAFDATTVITDLRIARVDPPDGAGSVDGATARDTAPGTRLTFGLTIDPSAVDPPETPFRVRARLIVRAFERSVLTTVPIDVYLGVGGDDPCR